MQTAPAPRIEFNPVRHYWRGRGGYQPVAIVEGMMQGTIEETWRYFTGRADDGNEYMVSAHYGVARDGRIWQFVNDEDTAWSNGVLRNPDLSIGWVKEVQDENVNCNLVTLSIEYEGFSGEPLTPEQYQAALELHGRLLKKWQIEVDAEHIIGRNVLDSVENADNPGAAFPLMDFLRDLLEREAAEAAAAVETEEELPVRPLGFADEIFAIAEPTLLVEQPAAAEEHISQEIEAVMLPIDNVIIPTPPAPEAKAEELLEPEKLDIQPAFVEEPLSEEFLVLPALETTEAASAPVIPLRDDSGITSGFLEFMADEEHAENEGSAEPGHTPDLEHLLDDYTSQQPAQSSVPLETKFPDQFEPADFLPQDDLAAHSGTFRFELENQPESQPATNFEAGGTSFELPDIPGFAIPAEKSGHTHPHFDMPEDATPELKIIPEEPNKQETLDAFTFEDEIFAPLPQIAAEPDIVNSSLLADVRENTPANSALHVPAQFEAEITPGFLDFGENAEPAFSFDKAPEPKDFSSPKPDKIAASEEPELPDFFATPATESKTGEPALPELPDFLNLDEPVALSAEKTAEVELPDFFKQNQNVANQASQAKSGEPDLPELPDFFNLDEPAAFTAEKTAEPELPNFLNLGNTAKTGEPALSELPDFSELDTGSSNKSSESDLPELPDFLDLGASNEAEKFEAKAEAALPELPDFSELNTVNPDKTSESDLPELPDFLDFNRPAEAVSKNEPAFEEELPNFLQPERTAFKPESFTPSIQQPAATETTAQDELGAFLLDGDFGDTQESPAESFSLPDFLDTPEIPTAPQVSQASAEVVDLSDLLELPPDLNFEAAQPSEVEPVTGAEPAPNIFDFEEVEQAPAEDNLRSALGGYIPEEPANQFASEAPADFGVAQETGKAENLPAFFDLEEPAPPVPVGEVDLPDFAAWDKKPSAEPELPDFEAAPKTPANTTDEAFGIELLPDFDEAIYRTAAPETPGQRAELEPVGFTPQTDLPETPQVASLSEADLPDFAAWDKEPASPPAFDTFAAKLPETEPNYHPAVEPAPEVMQTGSSESLQVEPDLAFDLFSEPDPSNAAAGPEFNYPFELPQETVQNTRPAYPVEFEASSPLDEYRRSNEPATPAPESPKPTLQTNDFLNNLYQIEEFPTQAPAKPVTEPLQAVPAAAAETPSASAGFDKFFIETEDTLPTQAHPATSAPVSSNQPAAEPAFGFDLDELDNELFPLFADEPEPVIASNSGKAEAQPQPDFGTPAFPVEFAPEPKLPEFPEEQKPATVFEAVPEEKFATVFEFEPKPAPIEPDSGPLDFGYKPEVGSQQETEVSPNLAQKQTQEFAPIFEESTPAQPAKFGQAPSPLDFVFDDMELEEVLTPAPEGFRTAFIGIGTIAVELANLRQDTAFDAPVIREAEEGESFNFDGWKYGPELRGSNRWLHFSNEGGGWIHSALINLKQPFNFDE